MADWFQKLWQSKSLASLLLLPVSWLFGLLIAFRHLLYRFNILKTHQLPVPLIVVGNISVGGTGKTPMVIYLAKHLQAAGYNPGIISRGYGGEQTGLVDAASTPSLMGDEPVLMAKRTGLPVSVNPDRVAAAQTLLRAFPECNVLISDDGLQHYRLHRDIEIALVNTHGLGNQRLLPAGPLREGLSRLQSVDMIVNSGELPIPSSEALDVYQMRLKGDVFHTLDDKQSHSAMFFKDKVVYAIAAIGHPQRFFASLSALGLRVNKRVFSDHHLFKRSDFTDIEQHTLLMTEKDAVKCQALSLHDAWYLPVEAELSAENLPPLHLAVLQLLKQSVAKET